MAGPIEPRDTEIVNAIADMIVARTSLVAQTTIVTPGAGIGSNVLPVSAVAGFTKRGHVHFFDDTGEHFAAISAVDPVAGTLTLDYAGYVEHGFPANLVFAHGAGGVVATNMMLHRPTAITPMLRTGAPVIAIWPRTGHTRELTFQTTISPVVIRIQVHMAIQQFDAAPMDAEVYNDLQQSACRDAQTTIENALNTNRHLMTRYNAPGNHAMGLGEGDVPWLVKTWDIVTEHVEIPQAVAAMDVTVRPTRFVR